VAGAGVPSVKNLRAGPWLPVAGLLVMVVVMRLPYLTHALATQDEAIIPVYADQILHGRVPHRDFYTAYGPATFGLTALAFKVLGSLLVVERLVGLTYQLLIVGGIFALCAHRGRRTATVTAAVSVFALTPAGLVAYAWLGGLACILWGLVLMTRASKVTAGMTVLSLCALFRPDMLVPAYLTALVLLRPRVFGRALIGVLFGLGPSVAYYASWGRRAIDNIFLQRLVADARLQPDGTTVSVLIIAFGVVGLIMLCTYTSRSRADWALATLPIFLLPQVMQRPDVDHLSFFMAVSGPLAVVALSRPNAPVRPGPSLRRLGATGLLVGLAAALAVPLVHAVRQPSHSYVIGDRVLQVTPHDARALDQVREIVSAAVPPGATLFVGALDMSRPTVSRVQLYFLFPELRATAYYLELPIGINEETGTRLAADVHGADVLLLSDFAPDFTQRLNPFIAGGPDTADSVVGREFCRSDGNGLAILFLRCQASEVLGHA
jgi:hypothetical protein